MAKEKNKNVPLSFWDAHRKKKVLLKITIREKENDLLSKATFWRFQETPVT